MVMSGLYFSSKTFMTAFRPIPIPVALYSRRVPEGSVSKSRNCPSERPAISRAVPYGRAPPNWV